MPLRAGLEDDTASERAVNEEMPLPPDPKFSPVRAAVY